MPRHLQKIAELLHLDFAQPVVEVAVGVDGFQNGSTACRHDRPERADLHGSGSGRIARREDANLHLGQGGLKLQTPPLTRNTSAPYASSFFAPIPLMPCKSSGEVGARSAMAASVASWKIT